MNSSGDHPKSIGPWQIQRVNFSEPGRSSYVGTTSGLAANILVLEGAGSLNAPLTAALNASKRLSTREIPAVLDFAVDVSPPWVASTEVTGTRLGDLVEHSGALEPRQWAELARTALIGCAALRSVNIGAFQLTPNTFVVTQVDVHLTDFWATQVNPSPFEPPTDGGAPSNASTHDMAVIARLLAYAMGLDPEQIHSATSEGLRHGFTSEHLAFLKSLAPVEGGQPLTTEKAVKAIPGRDPSWTVPPFALEKPWKPRAQRKMQSIILRAALVLAVVGAVAGLIAWVRIASSGDEAPIAAEVVEDPTKQPEPTRLIKLTYLGKEPTEDILTDVSTYTFVSCFDKNDLRMSEIPERLVLQKKVAGVWKSDPNVNIKVEELPRCKDAGAALTFTAPILTTENVSDQWSPCQDFRVLVPRVSTSKRANIRFCIQQRQEFS